MTIFTPDQVGMTHALALSVDKPVKCNNGKSSFLVSTSRKEGVHTIAFKNVIFHHNITEYAHLEGTHKDTLIQLLALHQTIPQNHTVCLGVLSVSTPTSRFHLTVHTVSDVFVTTTDSLRTTLQKTCFG